MVFRTVEENVLVDFVREHPDVARCPIENHGGNVAELLRIRDATGRVRREVEVDQLRAIADQPREIIAGQREAGLLAEVQGSRCRVDIAGEALVDRKPRRRVDDLATGVDVGLLAEADRRFDAGEDDHPFRRCIDTASHRYLVRDRLPETENSLRVAVVRVVGVELPFDFLPDVVRELEVGLADVAADDAAPGRLDLLNGGADREGVLGVDQPHPISEEGHDTPPRDGERTAVESVSTSF